MGADDLERRLGRLYPLAKQVNDALAGAVFPLERHHLVWVARENDAAPTLLTLLSALPARRYLSEDEVESALEEEDAQIAAMASAAEGEPEGADLMPPPLPLPRTPDEETGSST